MDPAALARLGVDLKPAGRARVHRGLPGGGGVRGVTEPLAVGEGRSTTGLAGSSRTPAGPVVDLPSPTARGFVTPRTPPPPGSPLRTRACPAGLRSTPGRARAAGSTQVPCSSAPCNVYYIPHPDEIMPPETHARRPKYFVITRGEEVGVFGNWYDDLSQF